MFAKLLIIALTLSTILALRFNYSEMTQSKKYPFSFKTEILIDERKQSFVLDTTDSTSNIFDETNENINGVIGLGISGDRLNFLNYLKEKSIIKNKIFYQNINEGNNEKFIVFGETPKCFSDNTACNGERATFCKASEKWDCDLDNIYIGNNFQKSFNIRQKAIFDLKSNVINFPENLKKDFEEKYFEGISKNQCIFDYWEKIYKCNKISNLKRLNFEFNNVYYTIPAKNIFYKNGKNEFIMMIRFKGDKFVMGQTFMKNFVVVFDQENTQIGFMSGMRTILPQKEENTIERELPNKDNEFELKHGLLIAFTFVAIFALGYYFYIENQKILNSGISNKRSKRDFENRSYSSSLVM